MINSESFSCVGKMPERRTRSAGPVQIKAPIAGKAQSNRCSQSIRCAHGLGPAHGASFSKAKAGPMSKASVVGLAKIGNAAIRRSELAYFNKQMLIHELIRGSLDHGTHWFQYEIVGIIITDSITQPGVPAE